MRVNLTDFPVEFQNLSSITPTDPVLFIYQLIPPFIALLIIMAVFIVMSIYNEGSK